MGDGLKAAGHKTGSSANNSERRCSNRSAPTTKEGIERYPGSGMVKGIGPVYEEKLMDTFGKQIFGAIETQSARSEEFDSIGPKRRKRIKDACAERRVTRTDRGFPAV